MREIYPDPFIPAGCLVVSVDPDVTPGWAEVAAHDGWLWTAHTKANIPLSTSETEARDGTSDSPIQRVYLPRDVGRLLARELPSKDLLFSDWVRVAFRFVASSSSSSSSSSSPKKLGILRIYVLPEDQFRHLIRRENASLEGSLKQLLASLDYSPALWLGQYSAGQAMSLHERQASDTSEGDAVPMSLLHMFNTIPSPKPQAGLLQDDSYQLVMDGLATSKLRGLKAVLYDYQVRSATVMLQREVCPGRVLDPRLVAYNDHSGRAWFYDDVSGTVLREPRYYDGVAGGILAEEMGTGKTLICLSLILATRAFPAQIPDMANMDPNERVQPKARGIRSLADMAAAVVSRESVPWRLYLQDTDADAGMYSKCIAAIARNPPTYTLPQFNKSLRGTTRTQNSATATAGAAPTITASCCSLVLVPSNLVRQWELEIQKHTDGLAVLVVDAKRSQLPSASDILGADVLLFSMPQFENLIRFRVADGSNYRLQLDLARVHFKRVIVDEGHRLGNSKMSRKSNILLLLDCLQISSRWIVTGTPSTGLFGVDEAGPSSPAATTPADAQSDTDMISNGRTTKLVEKTSKAAATSSSAQERKDLERIGSMASLYLGMRPWANTALEGLSGAGGTDRPADWNLYMQHKGQGQHATTRGKDCLRATLDSLIVRHRKSEVGNLLPAVVERVVVLDGSFQDKLCLNLFSMMIIFNAVQSQRVDQDYFFHASQQRALLQLLSNIRQSTFFGAYFYSAAEIKTALETAETFLADRNVPISPGDEVLLREAIAFGRVAAQNKFKLLADQYHEVPMYVKHLPGGGDASAWSIDQDQLPSETTCTTAPMMRALQQYLRPCLEAPHALQAMIGSGRFAAQGRATWAEQRAKQEKQAEKQAAATSRSNSSSAAGATLAGNTGLGVAGSEDTAAGSPLKKRAGMAPDAARAGSFMSNSNPYADHVVELAEPLARTQIVSTASAKLSYLIDAIVRHQADEKMLVFYDNENTAFYLAEHLEILQIQHLIYAKGLSAERRAQYVASFNDRRTETSSDHGDFRVMLMDISQAAFGLDMWAASRMYFISPVLNPQVEAQAIGRVRRISQKRQVSVETLVLKDSIEEVIVDRRQTMTQAEHRKMRSLLDDRPIYEWVVNARIIPLAESPSRLQSQSQSQSEDQMAPLETPQYLFGRGFGRVEHPDDGLVAIERVTTKRLTVIGIDIGTETNETTKTDVHGQSSDRDSLPPTKKRRIIPQGVRFA